MTTSKPANYKGTGRPTKLTPELQENICKYIAEGNYLSVACQAVGITPVTYSNWLDKAQEEEKNGGGMYFSFLCAVKRAEAEQEATIVARLVDAAMPGERKRVVRTDDEGKQTIEITETGGEWLSAATYLERRHPDRWGRKDRTRVDINETKEITITHVEYNLGMPEQEPTIEGEVREIPELEAGS